MAMNTILKPVLMGFLMSRYKQKCFFQFGVRGKDSRCTVVYRLPLNYKTYEILRLSGVESAESDFKRIFERTLKPGFVCESAQLVVL